VSARRIAVVTGSRADFGHLEPVMSAIAADPALTLQTVVTGQHLDARFGNTVKAVESRGFTISASVDIGLTDDSGLAVAQATGRAVSGLASAFDRLKPDVVLVLGDRFEILAAAIAALMMNIPLAHIHGGEVTEGAMDDAIRHALSKMASLHFVAAEAYAARLKQMGEDPAAIVVSGAPGLDQLALIDFLPRDRLAADLGLKLDGRFFVITFHPVTIASDRGRGAAEALIGGLTAFTDADMVFTGVNSDPGHDAIAGLLRDFAQARPAQRKLVASLGQQRYLSAVKAADAVIGNSSSGLIEAPALGTPSVNIGIRQKGRLRSASVIDCPEDPDAINAAIDRALDPAFHAKARGAVPAYGRGGAAAKIVATLKTADLAHFRAKSFRDIIPAP